MKGRKEEKNGTIQCIMVNSDIVVKNPLCAKREREPPPNLTVGECVWCACISVYENSLSKTIYLTTNISHKMYFKYLLSSTFQANKTIIKSMNVSMPCNCTPYLMIYIYTCVRVFVCERVQGHASLRVYMYCILPYV